MRFFFVWLCVTMYLMCGPGQLFFRCGPEMPKAWMLDTPERQTVLPESQERRYLFTCYGFTALMCSLLPCEDCPHTLAHTLYSHTNPHPHACPIYSQNDMEGYWGLGDAVRANSREKSAWVGVNVNINTHDNSYCIYNHIVYFIQIMF